MPYFIISHSVLTPLHSPKLLPVTLLLLELISHLKIEISRKIVLNIENITSYKICLGDIYAVELKSLDQFPVHGQGS